jgi:hypothetical protein
MRVFSGKPAPNVADATPPLALASDADDPASACHARPGRENVRLGFARPIGD